MDERDSRHQEHLSIEILTLPVGFSLEFQVLFGRNSAFWFGRHFVFHGWFVDYSTALEPASPCGLMHLEGHRRRLICQGLSLFLAELFREKRDSFSDISATIWRVM